MRLYGLRKQNIAGKVKPPEKMVWRCHIKHLLFSHISEIFVIAKEEVRQQLWTSAALQWVFPLRKFYTKQIFLSVRTQLRKHADAQPVKHLKR